MTYDAIFMTIFFDLGDRMGTAGVLQTEAGKLLYSTAPLIPRLKARWCYDNVLQTFLHNDAIVLLNVV